MIDLDKLSALEKAATPGPWYAWRRDGRDEVPHSTDGGIFTISKEMCVSVIELNVVDPDSQAGDNDGIYLEIIKLDDEESVVRDRWPNQDGDRHIVSTSDIYAIYHALVDQVEEVA